MSVVVCFSILPWSVAQRRGDCLMDSVSDGQHHLVEGELQKGIWSSVMNLVSLLHPMNLPKIYVPKYFRLISGHVLGADSHHPGRCLHPD